MSSRRRVACGGRDKVGGIALWPEQEVVTEVAVVVHVADDGLDGVVPLPLLSHGGRDAALLAGEDDAGLVGVMAAVAAVDIGAADPDTCDPLSLGRLADLPHLR